jgi:hypothetical protein
MLAIALIPRWAMVEVAHTVDLSDCLTYEDLLLEIQVGRLVISSVRVVAHKSKLNRRH